MGFSKTTEPCTKAAAATTQENNAPCTRDSAGPSESVNAEWGQSPRAGVLACAGVGTQAPAAGRSRQPLHDEAADPQLHSERE